MAPPFDRLRTDIPYLHPCEDTHTIRLKRTGKALFSLDPIQRLSQEASASSLSTLQGSLRSQGGKDTGKGRDKFGFEAGGFSGDGGDLRPASWLRLFIS
jgi:hypothetical protein